MMWWPEKGTIMCENSWPGKKKKILFQNKRSGKSAYMEDALDKGRKGDGS